MNVLKKKSKQMNNLYNALNNGEVEYKDGGVVHQRAPTATMLRAAKTLKQLVETNENNVMLINQLQQREANLINEITQLKEFYANNQSLRNDGQETSDLGGGSIDVPGSDSVS